MKKFGLIAVASLVFCYSSVFCCKYEVWCIYNECKNETHKLTDTSMEKKEEDIKAFFDKYVDSHKQLIAAQKFTNAQEDQRFEAYLYAVGFFGVPPYALCSYQMQEKFQNYVDKLFGKNKLDLTYYFTKMRAYEYQETSQILRADIN